MYTIPFVVLLGMLVPRRSPTTDASPGDYMYYSLLCTFIIIIVIVDEKTRLALPPKNIMSYANYINYSLKELLSFLTTLKS